MCKACRPTRIVALLALATAGCAAPNDVEESAAPDAVAVFEQVCLGTAPDFVGSEQRMTRAGLTDRRPDGARYRPDGAMSAKIQLRPEPGGLTIRRCSVVFDQTEPNTIKADLTAALNRADIATAPARHGAIGSRRATIWDVQIAGQAGRVILIPGRGQSLKPGLYLDLPSLRANA